jgi:mevalonate kinase
MMMTSKRPTINSETLRQNFPTLYQELFSSCQVVVSAADSFFWGGEYARFFGGMAIQQKLPLKTTVGLEFLTEKKFCFGNLYGYNPTKNKFEQQPYDFAKTIRLTNFLKEYWPTLDPQGRIKGLRIHFLSESRCGGGLGTTGVLMANLSACLLLAANRVSIEDISGWNNANVDDLLNHTDYESFRTVFRLAWRLTAINRDGNSSGATSFCAMMKTQYPVIFFSKNINKYLDHPSIKEPKTNLENCEIINEIPFWGSKLEEVFPLRLPQPWPIDIVRIFSGTSINTENIFKSLLKFKGDIEELEETVNKELAPNVHTEELDIRYLFNSGTDVTEKNRQFTYNNYINIFNITTIELLLAIKDLFLLGPNEDSLRKFVGVIRQAQDFNHFLGHSTPILDDICQSFGQTIAAENEFHIAGAKIEGIGKGGHIVCIGPADTISDKLVDQAHTLSEETKKDISIDWISSTDGFGEAGLTVEQFIPKSLYSSYVSPQCQRLTLHSNANTEVKIIDPQQTQDAIAGYDLTLFMPEHKILIKGKVLSSKEIPSAKATTDIIYKILQNPDFKIPNSAFGDTSYGQSRYELQSKIIIPLNKAFQTIAGRKLDFQVHGGMYDDYTVSLNTKGLKIAVVDCI